MKYRRFYRNGGTSFFTVVTNKRQKILTDDAVRLALRQAVMAVRERYPFEILAWVLMPDHLHTIWRLPDNNSETFAKKPFPQQPKSNTGFRLFPSPNTS